MRGRSRPVWVPAAGGRQPGASCSALFTAHGDWAVLHLSGVHDARQDGYRQEMPSTTPPRGQASVVPALSFVTASPGIPEASIEVTTVKAAIRLAMLGLLMGTMGFQAWASPQRAERTPDARPQQRAERSRSAVRTQQAGTRQPVRQNAVHGQRGAESAGSRARITGRNPHVPNKRVYAQRLQQEVAVHRTRMARLDQLDRIYSDKGMRAKVSEVQMIRNREVRRYQLLLQRFRDAMGPADFQRAAAMLRIRDRGGARDGTHENPVRQVSRRSVLERRNER